MRRAHRLVRGHRADPIDAQVVDVLEQILRTDSNCIDVGAHQGAILEHMVRLAPAGRHIAIEPLPAFAAQLRNRFRQVTVHEAAVSDFEGPSEFQHVETNPAYSGLKRRRYDRPDERVETITTPVRRLDDLVEHNQRVDLVKIDVEGGELGVLRGARRIFSKTRPLVIFEHGLGAADFYGTKPADVFQLLTEEFGLDIFTLSGWLSRNGPLDRPRMVEEFEQCRSYMFVAAPTTEAL